MDKKSYSEKLQDPRWQKKRLEVFQRDEFKCCKCGSDHNTLHVHHLIYSSDTEPWDYSLENFKTLCHRCHQVLEEFKKTDRVGYDDLKTFAGKNVLYVLVRIGKTTESWVFNFDGIMIKSLMLLSPEGISFLSEVE